MPRTGGRTAPGPRRWASWWRGLAPRRRRVLAAAVGLLVAVGVGVGAVTATAGGSPAKPADQAAVGPVLLVPGYGGSLGSLAVLQARLRAAGRDVREVGLGTATQPIADQVPAIERVAAAALARAGTIDVVGYSDGGVAVRAWLAAHPSRLSQVRRVVTLGAPHHGTDLTGAAAAFGQGVCSGACADVQPGSALLRRLNRDEAPAGPRWLTVRTALDQTVQPVDSAELAGAVNVRLQDVCADDTAGHGELPSDGLSVGIVVTDLGPGLPAPPAPGQCSALRAVGRGASS
ncbi:MAG: estB [Mycobacterium sp.]|nr:estB [Mycobacterium sp.]